MQILPLKEMSNLPYVDGRMHGRGHSFFHSMSRNLEVDCDRGKSKILAGRTAVNATSIRSCLWSVSLFRLGEDGGERSVADAPLEFPSARTLIGDGTLSSAYLCIQDNRVNVLHTDMDQICDSNKRSVVMQVSKSFTNKNIRQQ